MPLKKETQGLDSCGVGLTVPKLEHSKTVVLDALASTHSRRSWIPGPA
jgi:hypothetical protein